MTNIRGSITLIFLFFLICCSSKNNFESGNDKVVDSEGNYLLKDSCVLNIKVVDGIVTYNIKDLKQTILLSNRSSFSTYQNWYFYFDSRSMNLWIWSSDIGLLLWMKDATGKYIERFVVKEDSIHSEIPDLLYRKMPASIKQ